MILGPEMPEVTVKWAEEPINSYREAIISMMMSLEEDHEERGWDEFPSLGVVHGESLGGNASLSVSVPRLGDGFVEDYEGALDQLSYSTLMAEVADDEEHQAFLDTGVQLGFQGWLVSAEFNSQEKDEWGKPIGDVFEQRLIIFVDLDNEKYAVRRIRGAEKAEELNPVPKLPLVRALSMLTAASIMSIVRRNLDAE